MFRRSLPTALCMKGLIIYLHSLLLSCFPDFRSNNLPAHPAALLLPGCQQYCTLIIYLHSLLLSCFPDSSFINSNNLYAFPAALLLPRFQLYRTLITYLQLSCFPDFASMDLIALLHVLCLAR